MLTLIIGLGGNLGDRAENLSKARAEISKHFLITNISPLYETPALMPKDAPKDWDSPFLNQVLIAQANVAPQEILMILKAIEKAMGRAPAERWAPRMIDIDIIAYGDYFLRSDTLNIPHIAMHQRDFVLKPLCDISPDWTYPVGSSLAGKKARDLLAAVSEIKVSLYDAN